MILLRAEALARLKGEHVAVLTEVAAKLVNEAILAYRLPDGTALVDLSAQPPLEARVRAALGPDHGRHFVEVEPERLGRRVPRMPALRLVLEQL